MQLLIGNQGVMERERNPYYRVWPKAFISKESRIPVQLAFAEDTYIKHVLLFALQIRMLKKQGNTLKALVLSKT